MWLTEYSLPMTRWFTVSHMVAGESSCQICPLHHSIVNEREALRSRQEMNLVVSKTRNNCGRWVWAIWRSPLWKDLRLRQAQTETEVKPEKVLECWVIWELIRRENCTRILRRRTTCIGELKIFKACVNKSSALKSKTGTSARKYFSFGGGEGVKLWQWEQSKRNYCQHTFWLSAHIHWVEYLMRKGRGDASPRQARGGASPRLSPRDGVDCDLPICQRNRV